MAVSYAEKLKAFNPEKDVDDMIRKLPSPAPIDEVYIKANDDKNKQPEKKELKEEKPLTYYLKHIAMLIVSLILLMFAVPVIVYKWYKIQG